LLQEFAEKKESWVISQSKHLTLGGIQNKSSGGEDPCLVKGEKKLGSKSLGKERTSPGIHLKSRIKRSQQYYAPGEKAEKRPRI